MKKRNGFVFPELPELLPGGDMPGDKLQIQESHRAKVRTLLPRLTERLPAPGQGPKQVISIYGGSGVGKSEIASVLGAYLRALGYGCYILSGDNYPRRIPAQNDAERLRLYRYNGLKALAAAGLCEQAEAAGLERLIEADEDGEPALTETFSWFESYYRGGRAALEGYLGGPAEIDFALLNAIIRAFKEGQEKIWLKRMGRGAKDIHFSAVDFSATSILLLEWTHGNSPYLAGVDWPIYLDSTPAQTLAHRLSRGRDKVKGNPIIGLVLEIEQALLQRQKERAAFALSYDGQLSCAEETENAADSCEAGPGADPLPEGRGVQSGRPAESGNTAGSRPDHG